MDDITSLQIRIASDQATVAERRMKSLEKTGGKLEKSMGKTQSKSKALMGTVWKLTAAFTAAAGAGSLLGKVVSTTRDFQIMQASLETVTGSVEGMNTAWESLIEFATETPFSVKESINSFIKLVNFGLNPSERAMRAFGDTASAMGYTMNDMVQAVANATTGEFEPLKKFAIKAKKDGDDVVFTFRGVQTRVKNEIDAIQEYFVNLGEENFAGKMQKQMETLDGAFSNFGDAWDQLAFQIGEAGVGDAVEGMVRAATVHLEDLTAAFASGQIDAYLEAMGTNVGRLGEIYDDTFEGMGVVLAEFIDLGNELLGMHSDDIHEGAVEPWDEVETVLGNVPLWFSTMAGLVSATLDGMSNKIYEVANTAKNGFTDTLETLGAAATFATAPEGNGTLPNSSNEQLFNGVHDASIKQRAERDKFLEDQVYETWSETQDNIAAKWNDEITGLADSLVARETALEKAAKLRQDFDNKVKPEGDRLEQFRVNPGGGDGPTSPTGGGGGGGGRSAKAGSEESISDQYDTFLEEYEKGEQEIAERLLGLYEEREMTLGEQLEVEGDLIEQAYEARKKMILENTKATEDEKAALLAAAHTEYMAQVAQHHQATADMIVGAATDIFSNIASIGSAFGKKGFEASKGAAIAVATIKMYESAVSAYASAAQIPYIGAYVAPVAAAAAVAAGAANIANIKSQTYSGAYEHGGMIPAGGFGMVGEAGPEFVRGPAQVTSARTTADNKIGSSSGSNVTVNVINNTGQQFEATQTKKETEDGTQVQLTLRKMEEFLGDRVKKGAGPLSSSIEGSFGLSRGKKVRQ